MDGYGGIASYGWDWPLTLGRSWQQGLASCSRCSAVISAANARKPWRWFGSTFLTPQLITQIISDLWDQQFSLLPVGRLIQNFGNLVSKPQRTVWKAWFCSVVLSSSSFKAGASGSHLSRSSRPASGTSEFCDHQPCPSRWFHHCPCASLSCHQFHRPGSGSFQPRSRSQLQPSLRRQESPDQPPQPQLPQPPRSQPPHPPQPPQPPQPQPLFQLQGLQRSQSSQPQPQLGRDHPWFQSLVSASALEASSLWLGLRTLLGMSSSGGLSQATSGRVHWPAGQLASGVVFKKNHQDAGKTASRAFPVGLASSWTNRWYGCLWNGVPHIWCLIMLYHHLSHQIAIFPAKCPIVRQTHMGIKENQKQLHPAACPHQSGVEVHWASGRLGDPEESRPQLDKSIGTVRVGPPSYKWVYKPL